MSVRRWAALAACRARRQQRPAERREPLRRRQRRAGERGLEGQASVDKHTGVREHAIRKIEVAVQGSALQRSQRVEMAHRGLHRHPERCDGALVDVECRPGEGGIVKRYSQRFRRRDQVHDGRDILRGTPRGLRDIPHGADAGRGHDARRGDAHARDGGAVQEAAPRARRPRALFSLHAVLLFNANATASPRPVLGLLRCAGCGAYAVAPVMAH